MKAPGRDVLLAARQRQSAQGQYQNRDCSQTFINMWQWNLPWMWPTSLSVRGRQSTLVPSTRIIHDNGEQIAQRFNFTVNFILASSTYDVCKRNNLPWNRRSSEIPSISRIIQAKSLRGWNLRSENAPWGGRFYDHFWRIIVYTYWKWSINTHRQGTFAVSAVSATQTPVSPFT